MRILLCDPCTIYGFGLKQMLAAIRPDWTLNQVKDRDDIAAQPEFDLLLFYVRAGSYDYRFIKDIRLQLGVKFKAIALTEYMEDEVFIEFCGLEWEGLLIKPNLIMEIIDALEKLAAGQRYYSERIQYAFFKSLSYRLMIDHSRPSLSRTQAVILELICRQHSSKEIAHHIGLAYRTVEKYRDQLMRKTKSRNVVGLALFAIKHRYFFIDPEPDND